MATTEDGSQAPSALYLGNLPPSANQSSVKIFCHGAGCPTVMNVSMKQKKNADVVNKYAFVHFRDHDSARIAFVLLSNKSMDDNKLIINWSHHTTTASAKDADNAKKNGKAAGVSASAGGGQIISWKCKDPSCGNINPPSKNACAKCNLPQNIKLAQRKKEKSSQDAKSSKSASKATSDGAAAAGGKGHGQKAQARLEKIRQGKDDNKTGSSQKQEQTARPSIDKHLAAIFKIKAEIAENKASLKCDTHSEMVEVATEALHKMPDFALQGGWLLEDYTKLRKEMTFYQKWKTELTELEDSSLGAMKELAFNGAAKGLANSIDKYLTSFPHAEMKTVLEGIDDNLGVILDKHLNLLNTEPVEDWDKKAETSAASIYRKSAKTDQTGTAEDAFRTLSQAINDLKAAIDDGCPTPGTSRNYFFYSNLKYSLPFSPAEARRSHSESSEDHGGREPSIAGKQKGRVEQPAEVRGQLEVGSTAPPLSLHLLREGLRTGLGNREEARLRRSLHYRQA